MELFREYHSTVHWRQLVNGASGFKPTYLVKLSQIFDSFPDWAALDAIRHMGVDYLVLHRQEYDDSAWNNLMGLLPGYWPAIAGISSAGDDLVLQLQPPTCHSDPAQIGVDAGGFPSISLTNPGPATFFADPNHPSLVTVASQQRRFLEPLFILPGQTLTFTVPTGSLPPSGISQWQVNLANLGRTLTPAEPAGQSQADAALPPPNWQPIQVPFLSGAVLQAMTLGDLPETCGQVSLTLRWLFPIYQGETIRVELIDRFGRVTISQVAKPTLTAEPVVSGHALPLAETVPAGLYQVRVRLLTGDGSNIPAIDLAGAPVNQPLSLPIVIRPGRPAESLSLGPEAPSLANGISLLGADVPLKISHAGEWLRFTLVWQNQNTLPTDYTVFTQLLGPDGRVWGQHDNPPRGGWYPTSLWRPGEKVLDDYALRIDPSGPEGEYRLIVGMYDPATGERVKITAGPGQGNDYIEVQKISVYR